MEEGGARKKRTRKKMEKGRGEIENLLTETSRFLARIRQILPEEQAREAGVLVSKLEAFATSSSRDGSRERTFPPPLPASKAQRANVPPPLPSSNIRKKFPPPADGPTKSTAPPLPLGAAGATPKIQEKFEHLDTGDENGFEKEKPVVVKDDSNTDTTIRQARPPIDTTWTAKTVNDKIAPVIKLTKTLTYSESETEEDEGDKKREEAGSEGEGGSTIQGQSNFNVGHLGAPLAPEEEIDSDFLYSDGNNHEEEIGLPKEDEQQEYLQDDDEEHSKKNGADETYIEDDVEEPVVHAEEEPNYLEEEEKSQMKSSNPQAQKSSSCLPKQSPVRVRPGPPPPPSRNKPKSLKPTRPQASADDTHDPKFNAKPLGTGVFKEGEERLNNAASDKKPVSIPKSAPNRTKYQTQPNTKKAPQIVELEEEYDSMYQDDMKKEMGEDEAKRQTMPDSRTSSVASSLNEEDDMYDTVLPLSLAPSAKLETKYDLAVPGTGGLITTAEVLNGKADQVGFLFRKEGIFKSQQRYWVLIYSGVMYIYNDAKDREPQEKITLYGAVLKKLKDKNKDGKGFMLQIGKKKKKHEFETNDVKEARDWVRALEVEVNGRRASTVQTGGKPRTSSTTELSQHKSVPAAVTKPPTVTAVDIIEEDNYDSMYDRPMSADTFCQDDEKAREPPREQCEPPKAFQNIAGENSLEQGRRSFIPLPGGGRRSPSPTMSLPAQPRKMSAGHQAQAGPRPPAPRPSSPRPPGPRPPVGQPGRPGEDFGATARPAGQGARLASGQQTNRGSPG